MMTLTNRFKLCCSILCVALLTSTTTLATIATDLRLIPPDWDKTPLGHGVVMSVEVTPNGVVLSEPIHVFGGGGTCTIEPTNNHCVIITQQVGETELQAFYYGDSQHQAAQSNTVAHAVIPAVQPEPLLQSGGGTPAYSHFGHAGRNNLSPDGRYWIFRRLLSDEEPCSCDRPEELVVLDLQTNEQRVVIEAATFADTYPLDRPLVSNQAQRIAINTKIDGELGLMTIDTDGPSSKTHPNIVATAMTPNGRFVSFTTFDRLVSADNNDNWDVYRLDLETRDVKLMSVGVSGQALGAPVAYRLLPDGSVVSAKYGELYLHPGSGSTASVLFTLPNTLTAASIRSHHFVSDDLTYLVVSADGLIHLIHIPSNETHSFPPPEPHSGATPRLSASGERLFIQGEHDFWNLIPYRLFVVDTAEPTEPRELSIKGTSVYTTSTDGSTVIWVNEGTDIYGRRRVSLVPVKYDLNKGQREPVLHAGQLGAQPNSSSTVMDMDDEGNVVLLTTHATNLKINREQPGVEYGKLIVHDRRVGSTDVVSTNFGTARLSGDGRFTLLSEISGHCTQGLVGTGLGLINNENGDLTCIAVLSGNRSYYHETGYSIARDGQTIALESHHNSSLPPHDGVRGLYIWHQDTEQTIPLPSATGLADASSTHPKISADGSTLVFLSPATNLVDDDSNGIEDIFVSDLSDSYKISRISVTSDGSQIDEGTFSQLSVSADGDLIAFTSDAPALGGNPGVAHVYVHNRHTGETHRGDVDSFGNPAVVASSWPVLSQNGEYLRFSAGDFGGKDFIKSLSSGRILTTHWTSPDLERHSDRATGWHFTADGESYIRYAVPRFRAVPFDRSPRFQDAWLHPSPFVGPSARDDAFELLEDTPLFIAAENGLLSNDRPPPGGTVSLLPDWAWTRVPALGELELSDGGGFEFVPAADANGEVSFGYQVTSNGFQSSALGVITILPVNDPPSFSRGPDIRVPQQTGVFQTPWATAIDPGGGVDELAQNLTFVLNPLNVAPTLEFLKAPAIDLHGVLSFESTVDSYGVAEYEVFLMDDGGDDDSSVPTTFRIEILQGMGEISTVEIKAAHYPHAGPDRAITVEVAVSGMADARPTGTVAVIGNNGSSCQVTLPNQHCTMPPPGNINDLELIASYAGDLKYRPATSAPYHHPVSAQANSGPRMVTVSYRAQTETSAPKDPSRRPHLSADGRWVAFESASDSQSPLDSNGLDDIYVQDRLTGAIELISRGLVDSANGHSGHPVLSGDGRYVAFHSAADNLVVGDDNEWEDIFVYDRKTAVLERIDLAEAPNGPSFKPALSFDGRYVAFESLADNWTDNDDNTSFDVFVFDRHANSVRRVSQSSSGEGGDGNSIEISISADGSRAVFASRASNLIAGRSPDRYQIYVHHLSSGTTQFVSTNEAGVSGNGHSRQPVISADGLWVGFDSFATNLTADPISANRNIFLYSLATGLIVNVTHTANDDSQQAELTADGQLLAFTSRANNLASNDLPGSRDIFLFDRSLGTFQRASVDHNGEPGCLGNLCASHSASLAGNGGVIAFQSLSPGFSPADSDTRWDVVIKTLADGATDVIGRVYLGNQLTTAANGRAVLSGNGQYVAFNSSESLHSIDDNEISDVYGRDLVSGQLEQLSLRPDGSSPEGSSWVQDITGDGTQVAFFSWDSQIADGDTDRTPDLFVNHRRTGSTELILPHIAGQRVRGRPLDVSLSSTGDYIAFASKAPNLIGDDSNGKIDIFLYRPGSDQIELISQSTDSVQGNRHALAPDVSGDGNTVVFASSASQLVPDDDGFKDVFVRYVSSQVTDRISVDAEGGQARGRSDASRISTNGEWAVFVSTANDLVADDNNLVADIFLRDLSAGETIRVSVSETGHELTAASTSPSISGDGRYIVYHTAADHVVAEDTNGVSDVYLYDRTTQAVIRLSVNAAGIAGNRPSFNGRISDDGTHILFSSAASNLVSGDVNGTTDLFIVPNPLLAR